MAACSSIRRVSPGRAPAASTRRRSFGPAVIALGAAAVVAGSLLSGCGKGPPAQPAELATGTITLTDETWRCRGPVDLDLVEVTMRESNGDAVHLNKACTGVIRRMSIHGTRGDGVKVHTGAHDLEILGGRIDCGEKGPGKHQDAIQAMGGTRVTFHHIESRGCANSFMFINWGRQRHQKPEDVVCRDCSAETNNYSVSVRNSIRSGAVGGSFVSRRRPRATAAAVDPLLEGNTWTANERARSSKRAKS